MARDEGGSSKHGSATDLLRTATVPPGQVCRWKDCTNDWSFDCFFNLQTLSVSVRSRSGNVLQDFCWHGSVKDERDATKTSRIGLRTIRTLTEEIRKSYGYIRSVKTVRKTPTV